MKLVARHRGSAVLLVVFIDTAEGRAMIVDAAEVRLLVQMLAAAVGQGKRFPKRRFADHGAAGGTSLTWEAVVRGHA